MKQDASSHGLEGSTPAGATENNPAWMLEKSSVHAGFLTFMSVLQMLAAAQNCLLLRLKSLQKVGGNESLIGSTVKKRIY